MAQAEEGLAVATAVIDRSSSSIELAEGVPILADVATPPTIVKAKIFKPNKETPLGLGYLAQLSGWIQIVEVVPGGTVDQAAPGVLQAGMKLLSVNGVDFQGSTSSPESRIQDLIALLQTLEGDIIFVATNDHQVGYVSVTRPVSSFQDEPAEDEESCSLKHIASSISWHGLTFTSATGREVAVKSIDVKSSPFASHMTGSGVKLLTLNTIVKINDTECVNGAASCEDVERMLNNISEGENAVIYFTSFFERGYRPIIPITTMERMYGGDLPAPPGLPEGGSWGSVCHFGGHTQWASIVCCLVCGLIPSSIIACFPFDRRMAYKVDGRVYSTDGILIPGTTTFVEGRLTSYIDYNRRTKAFTYSTIATACLFLLTLPYIMLNA